MSHKFIQISKESVKPHAQYENFTELLALANYLLPSAHMIQKGILEYCLLMHPVVVVKSKAGKDRYFCVGGIRSFLLAQAHYNSEDKLSVILLERPEIGIIEELISTDVLAAPMLYSLRSPKTVGAAYNCMKEHEFAKLFKPKMGSKAALAKNMELALNTIFQPPEKTQKA